MSFDLDPRTHQVPCVISLMLNHGALQVGCYLSHIKAMESMQPGDVFAIFEEDAHFAPNGPTQVLYCLVSAS